MAYLIGLFILCSIVCLEECIPYKSYIDLSNDMLPYYPSINAAHTRAKRSISERLDKWEPIRITPFYMTYDQGEYLPSTRVTDDTKEYIMSNIDWAIEELKKVVLVRPLKWPIRLSRMCSSGGEPPEGQFYVKNCNRWIGKCQPKPWCNNLPISEKHAEDCTFEGEQVYPSGGGVSDSDLALYVTVISDSDCEQRRVGNRITFKLAEAAPCQKTNQTGTTEAGVVKICENYLQKKREQHHFRDVLLHEIFHVLLHALVGEIYIDKDKQMVESGFKKKIDPKTNEVMCFSVLPSVVEFAQAYFECPSLDAVKLEDCKKAHYDERLFPDGLMSPSMETGFKDVKTGISQLELAFLKDSGLYRINPSYTPFELTETQGRGCKFANQEK